MIQFKSFDTISEHVEESGDVLSVTVKALRDTYGAGRMGDIVAKNITKQLRQKGLGHYPNPLPVDQHEVVRLYRLGSQVGDLIGAVLNPSPETDEEIRNAANNEYKAIVEKMKETLDGA